MNSCNHCDNGVSDYNGRIVCKSKYIYPSFQDYSYNMFNKAEIEKDNLSIEFSELESFRRRLFIYGFILILLYFIFRLI